MAEARPDIEPAPQAARPFAQACAARPARTARTGGVAVAVILAAMAIIQTHAAHAHSGGLDRHGCHTQRSTGEYHCHRGAPPPAPSSHADGASAFSPPAERKRAPPSGGAFANCTEARAAGAAPVRRGDPGYGQHLDRDGDGIGCEPRR